MLAQELTGVLRRAGADLVGFGDLQTVKGCAYPRGIAVAVALPVWVLQGMQQGPTMAYSQAKRALDARLEAIALEAETFLRAQGYQAQAQVGKAVLKDEQWRTPVPHKTVATRAGLGWIGKSCHLINPQVGPRLRLTTILTDALLPPDQPISNRCGGCTRCRDACPTHAIVGIPFRPETPPAERFHKEICYNFLEDLSVVFGQHTYAKCLAACPWGSK